MTEKSQSVRAGHFRPFPLPRSGRKLPRPLSWLMQLVARVGLAVPFGTQPSIAKMPFGTLRLLSRSVQPPQTSQLAQRNKPPHFVRGRFSPFDFAHLPAHHPPGGVLFLIFFVLASKTASNPHDRSHRLTARAFAHVLSCFCSLSLKPTD